jgi:hypothetical protein
MDNCQWTWVGLDNFFQTDCGNGFQFTEGTPSFNNFKFCCYCGKPLVEDDENN